MSLNKSTVDELLNKIQLSKSNFDLPDPYLVQYYENKANRVIWLDDEVADNALEISKAIIQFNREDADIPVDQRKPIKLLIYSYGGDGNICFNIVDTITLSKTPVYTVNMGIAMSAALVILLAGHKRYCLKSSTALIHSGSGSTSGTFEQTEAQMKDYQQFIKTMREYIAEKTNIDVKLLNRNKSKEWYIYANDQVQLGVVDEIVSDIDTIL